MKHIPWLAILLTTASASFAFDCGCSSSNVVREKVFVQPVAERITTTTVAASCPAQPACAPMEHRTVYAPECPSCRWVQPDKNNPAYVIGNVLTAPFRAITGRELGQPDVVGTRSYSETMARPVVKETTKTHYRTNACGQPVAKKITMSRQLGLEPVGERLTTVKLIRLKPMPVAESCAPVAEQIIVPSCPAPVAERTTIIRSCPAPVAERLVLPSCNSCNTCPAPVGERVIIRSAPACSNSYDSCNSCW